MKGVRELKISGEVSCKRNLEEAVAPVIALMLILAVVATFISLYSTEYLPGLKEQSEIAQVSEIKEAFMDFSNDIGHIVSEKKGASYGHTIPLGAGDVIMSPEKSSGTLSVNDVGTIFNITDSSCTLLDSSSMINVTYKPSYSFWEGQGYSWQYGYINVTKDDIEVPMLYYTMDDVINEVSDDDGSLSIFAESFIEFEPEMNSGELNLTVKVVDLVPGEPKFVSGNSATSLNILSKESRSDPVVTNSLKFMFANGTEGMLPGFSGSLFETTNQTLEDLSGAYEDIKPPVSTLKDPSVTSGWDTITLEINESITVFIDSVKITVSPS
ncbi:hypothetical protein [Methanolacinia petrolearia]|uniref:hypothetical protein n=1 Tax=Methanolacinia petrolearia TaxID=54120 RepID=UPI003BAB345D